MSFESQKLPTEAVGEYVKHFENGNIEPIITEEELLEFGEENPEIMPFVKSFISYAERYAIDVWSMHLFLSSGKLDTEEGAEEFETMDEARTRLHTALVDSIAILSRALGKNGLNNEWVRKLTNGANLDRAACGSFALMLVYHSYLDKI